MNEKGEFDFEDLAEMIPGQLMPLFEGQKMKDIYLAMMKSLIIIGLSNYVKKEDQIEMFNKMITAIYNQKEEHENEKISRKL